MHNEKDRGQVGTCLCCGEVTTKQTTLTSSFLSRRAWGGEIEWSDTSRCHACGFAFYGRGLSKEEVDSYYKSYRDEKYFIDRNSCEPFYTRKVHDDLECQMGSETRKESLASYLRKHDVSIFKKNSDTTVLDFAGGTGRLISDLPGDKFVFDVSEESPAPGVTPITEQTLSQMKFDLVVCAQMIEHATDPKNVAEKLFSMVKPGGHLYIEVPFNETWVDYSCPGRLRDLILSFAKNNKWFNVAWDIYGTAFRVKLKVLPPLAFVPVREHLNYFTPKSLIALGQSVGGTVIDANRVEYLGTTHSFIVDDFLFIV